MGDELWCGQAQNGVNFDFEVKFDLECHGRLPLKTIGVLHLWPKFGQPSLNGWWVMARPNLVTDGRLREKHKCVVIRIDGSGHGTVAVLLPLICGFSLVTTPNTRGKTVEQSIVTWMFAQEFITNHHPVAPRLTNKPCPNGRLREKHKCVVIRINEDSNCFLRDGRMQATTIPEGQNWPRVKSLHPPPNCYRGGVAWIQLGIEMKGNKIFQLSSLHENFPGH